MDWNQKYIKTHKKHRGRSFQYTLNLRIQRFKANPPIREEHFSELEYLIVNYDYKKTLLKRYEDIISEDVKIKWLERHLRENLKYSSTNYNINSVLLPFYLINPDTENPKIDKRFLNDQLMLILGAVDHKFRKYRWRAYSLFEFLTPNFSKFRPNLQIKIIELLSAKTNSENIQIIKRLVLSNQSSIDTELVNKFIAEQIYRGLITPKMAIGIFRKIKLLNVINIEILKNKIIELKKGKYILNKINKSTNKS